MVIAALKDKWDKKSLSPRQFWSDRKSPFAERKSQPEGILAMIVVDQAFAKTGSQLRMYAHRIAQCYRRRPIDLHEAAVLRPAEIVAQQHGYGLRFIRGLPARHQVGPPDIIGDVRVVVFQRILRNTPPAARQNRHAVIPFPAALQVATVPAARFRKALSIRLVHQTEIDQLQSRRIARAERGNQLRLEIGFAEWR